MKYRGDGNAVYHVFSTFIELHISDTISRVSCSPRNEIQSGIFHGTLGLTLGPKPKAPKAETNDCKTVKLFHGLLFGFGMSQYPHVTCQQASVCLSVCLSVVVVVGRVVFLNFFSVLCLVESGGPSLWRVAYPAPQSGTLPPTQLNQGQLKQSKPRQCMPALAQSRVSWMNSSPRLH